MGYVLIYAVDGHEYVTDALASFVEVNGEIRKIYDRNSLPVTILRIEEDHDGPRTWQIEYPPAPPAGTRVRDRHGAIRTVGEDAQIRYGATNYSWNGALEDLGPLTEVVETQVEAAARRLREKLGRDGDLRAASYDDLRAFAAHVLNGGKL